MGMRAGFGVELDPVGVDLVGDFGGTPMLLRTFVGSN